MREDERIDGIRYALQAGVMYHSAHCNDLHDLPVESAAGELEKNLAERGLHIVPKTDQVVQYRDNLTRYFIDTEFYEDGETIDLISLGVVCSDGREFYAVSTDARLHRCSPWLREHVLPQLPPYGEPEWMSREQIARRFREFVPIDQGTEFWGYYADYDWVALCQLYGTMMKLPNHFPRYCMDLKQLSWLLGHPAHPPDPKDAHNALADARWSRDLYAFLRTVPSGVWGYGR